MTVTVTHGNRFGPIVQLALGSEVRTLQRAEFTDFLLSMIEEGRKATTEYLESLGDSLQRRTGERRGPLRADAVRTAGSSTAYLGDTVPF